MSQLSSQLRRMSEREMSDHILMLYEQIQKITISNLQMAKKNSQLEIQIRTIDDIIGQSARVDSTDIKKEFDFDRVVRQQRQLANRVEHIESIIMQDRSIKNSFGTKTIGGSSKVTSIQNIPRCSSRKGIAKIDNFSTGGNTLRKRDQNIRKSKFS